MNSEIRTLFDRAVASRNAGRLADARKSLEQLALRDPGSATIRAVLADIYWDEGKLSEACATFEIAIELAPFSEAVSLGYFHCLWEQEKREDALDEAKRFLNTSESSEYRKIIADIAAGSMQ